MNLIPNTPLSEEEIGELDVFLMSDATPSVRDFSTGAYRVVGLADFPWPHRVLEPLRGGIGPTIGALQERSAAKFQSIGSERSIGPGATGPTARYAIPR